MELINQFKKTLLENGDSASMVTVKNYIADIRKFVSWYETSFQRSFPPPALPLALVEAYMAPIRNASPRSAKRYQSSLRRFFAYLLTEGKLSYNPLAFSAAREPQIDPLHLKQFNNYLYSSNASAVTIKNYVLDVNQFLNWAKHVSNDTDLFAKIDSFMLDEYKNRLVNEAHLSPLSVNRKLSALRKYISWASDKGIIKNHVQVGSSILESAQNEELARAEKETINSGGNQSALDLDALKEISLTESEPELPPMNGYSKFGPFRLFQKSKKAIGLILDTLIVLSIIKAVEFAKYNLWKTTGKQVFAPLPTIIKTLGNTSQIPTEALSGSIPPRSSFTVVDRFITASNAASAATKIRSIPKSVYAPFRISTETLPFWGKILFHLKHTRPKWYKIYHSYTFIHYLHFAIVLVFASFAGFKIYQSINSPAPSPTVLAQRVSPGRLLSFQGQLSDSLDTPITKESVVKFAIYNNPTVSGSTLLWQEKQNVQPDSGGNFSVTLGRVNKIEQDIFNANPNLYLGISVGSDPELIPRQEIANVGLTKNAEELQGLKPITVNNAETSNVILALDSSGNLTIGGSATPVFQAIGGEFKLSGQQLTLATNQDSNTNIVLSPDGTGIIDAQKPLQNTSNNNNLLSALGAVEVDDNFAILASTSAQSAFVINQNSTGDLISAATGGIAKFTIDNKGSGTFAADVSILGNNLSTVTGTFNIANTNTLNLNIGGAASAISIGAKTGATTINHNLNVTGIIKAEGGLILPSLSVGSIPFIGPSNQLTSDNLSLVWDAANKRMGVGTNTPSKTVDIAGEIQVNLAGTQTSTALCGSHSAASGATVSDVTIVDCIGTPAADYMEMYSTEEGLELGDIVAPSSSYVTTNDNDRLIRLKKSTTDYQSSVIGIISDKSKAGDFNSIGHNIRETDNPQPVALNGRVPVKISSDSRPIKPGDYITSSTEPGKAMKAEHAGVVVGKALESWDPESGKNKIMVYVNLSWHDPRAVLMDNGAMVTAFETDREQSLNDRFNDYEKLALSIQTFINTLNEGLLEANKISTKSLTVATEDVKIGAYTLREYITSIVNEILDKRLAEERQKTIIVVSPLATDNGTVFEAEAAAIPASESAQTDLTPSPTPTSSITPTPTASQSGALASDATTYNITNIYNNVSSASATPDPLLTPSPTSAVQPTPTASPSAEPTLIATESAQIQNTQTTQQSGESDNQIIRNFDISDSMSIPSFPKSNTNFSNIATYSAELSYIPNLKSDYATYNQGLIALGPTSLSETSISTQLSIGQTMTIDANSINTIGTDLNLQPLRQGSLSIMGGLMTIDTQGNLTVEGNATFVNDVAIKGKLAAGIIAPIPGEDLVFQIGKEAQNSEIEVKNATGESVLSINPLGDLISSGSAQFSNFKIVRGAQADTSFTETVAQGSAGTAVITTNETERTVVTPYVTENSLIYITAISPTQGTNPYIARQTTENLSIGVKGSFTIQIPNPITSDIKINWWIIN